MISSWLLGFFLCLISIWFIKNSRVTEYKSCTTGPVASDTPVLRVWILLILILLGLLPIVNIVAGSAAITAWAINTFSLEDWVWLQKDTKVVQFLKKPIK